MNREEALIQLRFHSGRHPDINHPKWRHGLIGSLNYFDGQFNEENFVEVMECLKVLSSEFAAEQIDRDLMADLYGILYQINLWIVPGGKLEHIDPNIKNKLVQWLKLYADVIELLLEYSEQSCQEAFYEYECYRKETLNQKV